VKHSETMDGREGGLVKTEGRARTETNTATSGVGLQAKVESAPPRPMRFDERARAFASSHFFTTIEDFSLRSCLVVVWPMLAVVSSYFFCCCRSNPFAGRPAKYVQAECVHQCPLSAAASLVSGDGGQLAASSNHRARTAHTPMTSSDAGASCASMSDDDDEFILPDTLSLGEKKIWIRLVNVDPLIVLSSHVRNSALAQAQRRYRHQP
jgi:hypothetical protein